MKHGSLFSGIGGFDLAAQWMGWENVFHCEINKFCQKVLKYHFPNSTGYADITKTDFTIHRNKIDVLTGGFPCQPFSVAGKRKGTEDDRYLWSEMLRAIREIQPGYIVGENVRGLTNWNRGMVFDKVQSDLEIEGFEVLPFLLPACAINAPHRRDRIWFIAKNSRSDGRGNGEYEKQFDIGGIGEFSARGKEWIFGNEAESNVANSKSGGLEGFGEFTATERLKEKIETICTDAGNSNNIITNPNGIRQAKRCKQLFTAKPGQSWRNGDKNDWENFPTQSPLCSRNDGLSPELSGITISAHRTESIRAYGNAIVPQVAYEIFKAINALNPI